MKKISFSFLAFLLLFLIFSLSEKNIALAGFGITPPYFKNDNLTRESYYEQKITLVRGDPVEDSKVEIKINVPGANDWISVDKGNSFILPKGEKSFPITLKVKVPKDAPFNRYKGNIRITVAPANLPEGGGVAIALGAQVDVDLNVTKQAIFDFLIKKVEIPDFEEGHKWWIFYLPGKITMNITLENLGNIPLAPNKVQLAIYDYSKKNLLESQETKKIKEKVLPFQTGIVRAFLPTKTKQGVYWAQFKVFKDKDIVAEGELPITIHPYGTLVGYKGYEGFLGLTLKDKIIFSLIVLTPLVLILIFVFIFLRKKKKKKK